MLIIAASLLWIRRNLGDSLVNMFGECFRYNKSIAFLDVIINWFISYHFILSLLVCSDIIRHVHFTNENLIQRNCLYADVFVELLFFHLPREINIQIVVVDLWTAIYRDTYNVSFCENGFSELIEWAAYGSWTKVKSIWLRDRIIMIYYCTNWHFLDANENYV